MTLGLFENIFGFDLFAPVWTPPPAKPLKDRLAAYDKRRVEFEAKRASTVKPGDPTTE